jgi:light-regulated signal transduction histidine kinase (bacteriophytochrome)
MSTVDLTNCDREPIHIPGSVQPHGCMLVCDEEAVIIRRHSVNATEFLGLPEGSLSGGASKTLWAGNRCTSCAMRSPARARRRGPA